MAGAHEIREGMEVLGSDGMLVGTVEGVHGDQLRLRPDASGAGRSVPLAWAAQIDAHVHLDRPAQQVEGAWAAGAERAAAPPPKAATDRPAAGSKWVWIIGVILLVMIIILGIRGCGYAASEQTYEEPGAVVDAPAN